MKLLPVMFFPIGLVFVVYGFREKSMLLGERAGAVIFGLLAMAFGLGYGFLVFRLVFK